MKVYRTLLFIPAIKQKWLEDLTKYEVDAIIIDLEDSVPVSEKANARKNINQLIDYFQTVTDIDIFIRINKDDLKQTYDEVDLQIAVQPGIDGIVLPKVKVPAEIDSLSDAITKLEKSRDMPIGSTAILPILETAKSIYYCYEIANSERVIGITGLSSKNGDVQRALRTEWTESGLESLYIKSKVVLAARAANVTPIGGLWQNIHDHEGLRKSAEFNRQLGFDGELIIHPDNASVINNVYSPSSEEIAYYEGMIAAFEKAQEKGEAAVMYEGSHIDLAHIETAKDILKLAAQIKRLR